MYLLGLLDDRGRLLARAQRAAVGRVYLSDVRHLRHKYWIKYKDQYAR
jgi:hypothetical protein